ncbi:TerB N-terminal domain-containing protein [Roseomonas sp. E05]|uniref:tellurite resistance TerB family protein n=1 Tax=Roseomonas sp. E05 TaxID=3046310 RepID=UPI0024B9945F|nr:TerB N-terminal domain-containing protein [Roseomonas sp. E05]MDJ0390092.1 TerB N-terminal domain-containing protein [Roseomonas sp. E05]
MPSPLILQLAGGLVASGVAWLLMRQVLQARDTARTEAARRSASPFLLSKDERAAESERRARLAFEAVMKASSNGPQQGGPAAPASKVEDLNSRPEGTPQTAPASELSTFFVREGGSPGPATPSDSGTPLPSAAPSGQAPRSPSDNQALGAFSLNPSVPPSVRAPTSWPSPWNEARAPTQATQPAAVELAKWIPPGTEVKLGGTQVTGGMIYVGENLPSPKGWGMDRCLINPSLRVARTVAADDVASLNYWPEYGGLSPARRRAYIDWLAGGRVDPQADIGLVFLFFYGLERRLFFDRQVADAAMLTGEVERLLDIYAAHVSFKGYATTFLAAAALLSGKAAPTVQPSAVVNWSEELPLATRLHLGVVLSEGKPLGADDALLWVLGSPETRLRTPGQRCFEETRSLFARHFVSRHPKGLAVRTPQRRVSVSYRAASDGFTVSIPGPHENLPDISGVNAPLSGLRDMLEASQTELDAYSRLLGRRPEARGTFEAAMLLPPGLREEAMAEAGEAVRRSVKSLLGEPSMASVAPRPLLDALGVPLERGTNRLPVSVATQVLQRLDALGFGMEPDRRYGGEAISMTSDVVLFEAPDGAAVDPDRPAFNLAKAAMEVAALAASADGDVSDLEFQALLREARAMPDLNPAETTRLEAFVWRLRERTKSGGALKKAADLPPEARQAIARAAISAVLADGQASRAEVAFLEKLHKTLGLPPEAVHSALHQGASGDFQTPRPAGPAQSGGAASQSGIALDAERMARIRQETTQVASLLSSIFTEEAELVTEAAPAALEPAGATAKRFEGLDDAHGTLLGAVAAAGFMPMTAFEAETKRLRLFPEGAIETINDWAFERFEEPILENDDDMVAVAEHLRSELPTV